MAGNALMRSLRLLLLLPVLAGLAYGFVMTKFTSEMQSGEPGFASNLVLRFGAAWMDHSAGKTRDAVIDTAGLNDERTVMLSREVAITDLPGGKAGDLTGPRAEIAAFAMARQWAETECDTMIISFATSCQFSTARAAVHDDGSVALDIALSFASAAPVGDTTGLRDASLIPERVDLTDRNGIEVAAADLSAERAKIYAAADAACTALRAAKGTCVIANIVFDEDRTETGMIRLTARGQIASLGARVTASELVDLGLDVAAENPGDPAALATAFAEHAAELEAAAAAITAETGGGSLFDRADQPRLQNAEGGAKFLTAP